MVSTVTAIFPLFDDYLLTMQCKYDNNLSTGTVSGSGWRYVQNKATDLDFGRRHYGLTPLVGDFGEHPGDAVLCAKHE